MKFIAVAIASLALVTSVQAGAGNQGSKAMPNKAMPNMEDVRAVAPPRCNTSLKASLLEIFGIAQASRSVIAALSRSPP